MLHEPKTISDLIGLWAQTPEGQERKSASIAFAGDLCIPVSSVRCMKHRGSIAKRHWPELLAAAERHATALPAFAAVTAHLLVKLSAKAKTTTARDSLTEKLPRAAA